MANQRGVALSGLLMWGIVLSIGAVFGMKVVPTYIEYQKIIKDAKSAVAKVDSDASVSDVRRAFDKFAEIDMLDFNSSDLNVSKRNGQVVIDFDYERRIPLFANVSLVIDYQGSTAQ